MSITHLPTDDPTLASRYLDDRLTDAEREAFEARMVEDPEVLRELEATARMKLGMEKLRKQGVLEGVVSGSRTTTSWPLGMAAALAVVMISFGVWRMSTNQSIVLATSPAAFHGDATPLQVLGPYAVYRKRSDSYDGDVPLPIAQSALELKLLPAVDLQASAPLRVSLTKIGEGARTGSEIKLENPQPDADGFITIFVDSSRVSPGLYELRMTGAGSASESETLRVRFVADK